MTRLATFAALAIATTLGACATSPDKLGQVADPRTPTEQWKAELTSQPEEVQLAIHANGLSVTQADALAVFVDDWRESDGGTITIQAPAEGADTAAAFRAGEATRGFLINQGVNPELIRVAGYRPEGEGKAPLRVGYLRHSVVVPKCGEEWDNIAHSAMNRVQSNFGCAVTANMAAQIANPADLAGPRALTPADAQRRAVVIDKYRKGEATSTARDSQAAGTIATAVQ